jgi:hypothetical protein
METTENNKLIAEFMGDGKEYEVDINTKTLKSYNTSWDWLMPVVEQCLEKHNNLIDGRDVIDTPYSSIAQALQVVSLKETYNAVVEFIKEYNKQN